MLDFWKDQEDCEKIEIRFTACKDYQLAYMDFIDTRLTKDAYDRPPLPMTIMTTGNGSFSQPFQVNRNDPLCCSMQFYCEDNKVSLNAMTILDVGDVLEQLKQYASHLLSAALRFHRTLAPQQHHRLH